MAMVATTSHQNSLLNVVIDIILILAQIRVDDIIIDTACTLGGEERRRRRGQDV